MVDECCRQWLIVHYFVQSCYGKFDSNLLILCDYCEQEIHTYCFRPEPLACVPDADPWYCCGVCADLAASDAKREDERDSASGSAEQEEEVVPKINTHRRGRPPRLAVQEAHSEGSTESGRGAEEDEDEDESFSEHRPRSKKAHLQHLHSKR